MRILFLDTETNGLPKNRYAPYTMTTAWPTIVQLAWEVWDVQAVDTPVLLYQSSFLIQPAADVVWDAGAMAIHGISEEKARAEGIAETEAMKWFVDDAGECDIVVAHNLAFDKPVIWSTAHRLGYVPPHWWPTHEICTMLASNDVCRIPSASKWANSKDPYKWPKLAEMWQTLFPALAIPMNLHDAAQDVHVLVTCFHELVRLRHITLPAIGRSRSSHFMNWFQSLFSTL